MLLQLLFLPFAVMGGSVVVGLAMYSVPSRRRWSLLALVPFLGALFAFIFSFALACISGSFLGFLGGFVFGGLFGAGLGLWLPFTFWHFTAGRVPNHALQRTEAGLEAASDRPA